VGSAVGAPPLEPEPLMGSKLDMDALRLRLNISLPATPPETRELRVRPRPPTAATAAAAPTAAAVDPELPVGDAGVPVAPPVFNDDDEEEETPSPTTPCLANQRDHSSVVGVYCTFVIARARPGRAPWP